MAGFEVIDEEVLLWDVQGQNNQVQDVGNHPFMLDPNGPKATDYKQEDQISHVYKIPDMYVGSDKQVPREDWVLDTSTMKMVYCTLTTPQAVERLFLEIIANSADNVGRSRRAGVDPGRLVVTMSNKTISITNCGLPIPIEIHPQSGVYVPQMIFGTMLTSSSYDIQRHEIGRNGIGAKACNIFSHSFTVTVLDHIRHLAYKQQWTGNMRNCSLPDITQYAGTNSSVTIAYEMDFMRFGYSEPMTEGPIDGNNGYAMETQALFARHAADISFTTKVPVSFNGQLFQFSNPRDYAKLYFDEEATKSAILHYEWPEGTQIHRKREGVQIAANPHIMPNVEMLVLDTPDAGRVISFANSLMTRDGGVHVDAALKAISKEVIDNVNAQMEKSQSNRAKAKAARSKNKAKAKGKKEEPVKRAHKIDIRDVKPHISMLLSVRVIDPQHTSQSKTNLASPVPKITVNENELKAVKGWRLMDRLYQALLAKHYKILRGTNGNGRRRYTMGKGQEANEAGGQNSHQCALYVTEGRSGMGYITRMLTLIPNGRDWIGVLPLRGKGLNVMNASMLDIAENTEIKELKKMLNLQEGLDYTVPANFATLKYGSLVIAADSDVDGKHIIGLTLLFLHHCFPTLLMANHNGNGFAVYMRTPWLRVMKGHQKVKFYTKREYEYWKSLTPGWESWKQKYYKGLGTSTEADVKDDFRTSRMVRCFYDIEAPDAFRLAFHKDLADERKQWIAQQLPIPGIDEVESQPISWFLRGEFIEFSRANLKRMLPRQMDGLKTCMRKILWAAWKKWNIGNPKKKYEQFKVAQFAAYVAEKTNYHHGEVNLSGAITGMAQDFVGAKNMPYFTRDGEFGSRDQGGKDCSEARYIFTRPEWWIPLVFRKEDEPLLTPFVDDGDPVEPVTFYPIIPMALVNGCEGIGSGWSSFVPCHNPLDLVQWIRDRINGTTPDQMNVILPWYRGFTGDIRLIDRRHKKKVKPAVGGVSLEVEETYAERKGATGQVHQAKSDTLVMVIGPNGTTFDKDPEDDFTKADGWNEMPDWIKQDETNERPLLSMVTYGEFHIDNRGVLVVDELPIGRWTLKYTKWLESLMEAKEILNFRSTSNAIKVRFEIHGMKKLPGYRSLRLIRSFGLSNMVFLDNNDRPIHYATSNDYMNSFFEERLPIYEKRRLHIINTIEKEIRDMQDKIRFIIAVINGELLVMNRPKAEVLANMRHLQLPEPLYTKVKIRNCSVEEINELNGKIQNNLRLLDICRANTASGMWLQDLAEFERAYRQYYKMPQMSQPSGAAPMLEMEIIDDEPEADEVEGQVEQLTIRLT
jgi:DNA topoisomerase-2